MPNCRGGSSHSLRGYSLIEIMLALVVLGILLSAVLTPISLRFELETTRKVHQTMQEARDAVFGYAIINRTAQRNAFDPDDNRHYQIPSGRPYLPCPDVTGDGLEDRNPINIAPNVLLTLNNVAVMTVAGVCQQQKGMLPWRSLGLQEQGDYWGRHLTYWVDPAFSNQLLGFDESFRADTSDPRLTLEVANRGLATETRFYSRRAKRNMMGAIVCSDFLRSTVVTGTTGGCPDLLSSSESRQLNVLAGVVNTAENMMTVGARRIAKLDPAADEDTATGVVDGVVFVVVSHGKNGFGAIRQPNVGNAVSLCAQIPPSRLNESERANAYYHADHPFRETTGNFKCAAIANADDLFAENIYVSGPPESSHEHQSGGDDIVVWSSANLLIGKLLESGALPIPRLQHLPRE